MKKPLSLWLMVFLTSLSATGSRPAVAQQPSGPPDRTIDSGTRSAVIESVLKMLNESYVFLDVAKKVSQAIRDRVARGDYDSITSARNLGAKLTDDLRALANDQHIGVRYWPSLGSGEAPPQRSSQERREASTRELARINHTFQTVERLPGNIGYIEFFGFTDAELGAETVAAAMNFVASTDALIFDLRGNGGGIPEMVALISSYLFPPEPLHLSTLYWRQGDSTRHYWTRKDIFGKRYVGKDVYILTSRRTFSAAEEFAYNLKNLKRATIVGETSGGGAHPGMMIRFLKDYEMFVPMGRAINPITKSNWEGSGVKPDVEVPADQALIVARLMILRKSILVQRNDEIRAGMQSEIDRLEKELADLKTKK